MVIYYDKNSVRLSHMNYVEYLYEGFLGIMSQFIYINELVKKRRYLVSEFLFCFDQVCESELTPCNEKTSS